MTFAERLTQYFMDIGMAQAAVDEKVREMARFFKEETTGNTKGSDLDEKTKRYVSEIMARYGQVWRTVR